MENKKSPTRTFFILHRETILEAPPRFELGIKVLQTFALPLGYSADWSGLRGSNSLPPPWQGGALPDELKPRFSERVLYYSTAFGELSRSKCEIPLPRAGSAPAAGRGPV